MVEEEEEEGVDVGELQEVSYHHLNTCTYLCAARDNGMLFAMCTRKSDFLKHVTAQSCDFVVRVRLTNNDTHESCLSVRHLSGRRVSCIQETIVMSSGLAVGRRR